MYQTLHQTLFLRDQVRASERQDQNLDEEENVKAHAAAFAEWHNFLESKGDSRAS
jgi:hypothetical protein